MYTYSSPEDDPIVQISQEMIRVANSHIQVARALSNAHSKEGSTKNFASSQLVKESEQVGLCVTDFGIIYLTQGMSALAHDHQ